MGEPSETIAAVLLLGLLASGLWQIGRTVQRCHLERVLRRGARRGWPAAPIDPRHLAWQEGYAAGEAAGSGAAERSGYESGLAEGLEQGRAAGADSASREWRAHLVRLAEEALPLCWPDEHPPERAERANQVTGMLLDALQGARRQD